MKTLKLFILLTGLFAFINTNLNAQLMGGSTPPTPSINMMLAYHDSGNAATPTATGQAQVLLTLTSDIPIQFRVKAKNRDQGTTSQMYFSNNDVTSYTVLITFPGNIGDEVFIECGYISFINGAGQYMRDGGCTVVIEPF